MTNAFYEGVTWHERRVPFQRKFTTKMWLAFVDVDDIAHIDQQLHLFSTHRFRPLQFRRSDYFGDDHQPIGDAIRDYVEGLTGERPAGAIFMLSQLRTWGWCFNPLSLYYCTDTDGALQWIVAEVTNTPWNERETYFLPADDSGVSNHEDDKRLHVSPLWPMSQRHRFVLNRPDETVSVRIENIATEGPDAGSVVHAAGMELHRLPLNDRKLASLLLRRFALTHRVSFGIYRHATAIKMRGATFYSHPKEQSPDSASTQAPKKTYKTLWKGWKK